jgi:hypothetical protein
MMVKQRVVLFRKPGLSLLPAGSERLNYRCCQRAMSAATGIGQISETWLDHFRHNTRHTPGRTDRRDG